MALPRAPDGVGMGWEGTTRGWRARRCCEQLCCRAPGFRSVCVGMPGALRSLPASWQGSPWPAWAGRNMSACSSRAGSGAGGFFHGSSPGSCGRRYSCRCLYNGGTQGAIQLGLVCLEEMGGSFIFLSFTIIVTRVSSFPASYKHTRLQ